MADLAVLQLVQVLGEVLIRIVETEFDDDRRRNSAIDELIQAGLGELRGREDTEIELPGSVCLITGGAPA
jgi:hypothetical protein